MEARGIATGGPAAGYRRFGLIWGGQLVSVVGTGMSGFALGVWIFQTTGSVTQFTLAAVFAALPGLLLMPWLGVWIDRWGPRTAMLVGDTGAALRTLALLALALTGNLEVWHVYVAAALRSIFEGLQVPAYLSAVTVLVSDRNRTRANGMIQFAAAAAGIVSPAAAGLLLGRLGLEWVLVVDLVTFAIGVTTLAVVRIPRPSPSAGGAEEPAGRWRRATFGWRYIRRQRGLLALALFFAVLNLFIGFAMVLLAPLVLSFAEAEDFGWVMALGGAGALAGGLVISAWGGPRRRALGVLALSPFLGVGLVAVGLEASLPMIAAGTVTFFFFLPVVNSLNHSIWQGRVPADLQGRVFTTRTLIGQITAPVAYLVAGPLADRLFRPLLVEGGPLAATLGPWLGVGEGRGMGLQFVAMGLLLVAISLVAMGYRPLREADHEEEAIAVAAKAEPRGVGGA